MKKKFKIKLSVWKFLALGYLAVIIFGSILLVLPFAAKDGEHTSYIDALFTATSATCVTGLTPYPSTAGHWSVFGQIVILLLIQTGGLGFMTFVSSVVLIFRHSMGLYERRALLISSGGGSRLNGIGSLLRRIFAGTAIFEFLGTCLLCIPFCRDFGGVGVYYALFHSVSAFCNAGFDVLGSNSLANYATDPVVTLTVCTLILLGGLGFLVWSDVIDCRGKLRNLNLNTKVVLLVSAILVVISTAMFMGFEWNHSMKGHNFGEKLLMSLFNACTPRTAGFYTTYPGELSESGYLLTVILMCVGGNSGSTAGGIKVGTAAVIIMGMASVFRGRKDINIGKKRLDNSLVPQALSIFAAFLIAVVFASLLICAIEEDNAELLALTTVDELSLVDRIVFECFSAMGTVGLSLSATPHLSIASKIIVMLLMYAGRVGILTLALALGEKRTLSEVRKPVDRVMIG